MRIFLQWVGMGWFVMTSFAAPVTIWDVEWARTAPLDVQVLSETNVERNGVPLVTRELTYLSHEWEGEAIRIAGHLAMPASALETPLPAMILVTSTGDDAQRLAAENQIVALAIDRVGEGASTGPADIYENWLDLEPDKDIRNSWMYHYVMSAIRAVTYLNTLDAVRPDAIGISGVSRGGLCSLLTSIADDRIALAVPIAATGDFARTTTFEHNWLDAFLLRPTGRTHESPSWTRFVDQYDPTSALDQFHGVVWILNGAQDEFFPITSSVAIMEGADARRRIEVLYDADHGYFGQDTGIYDTYLNKEAWPRIGADLNKAIRTVLHGKGRLPATPQVEITHDGGSLRALARIDTQEPVVAVQLIYSEDGAYTFERVPMERTTAAESTGSAEWAASAELVGGESLAAFVEVQYRDESGDYYLTSVPYLTEGFVPKIRPAPSP